MIPSQVTLEGAIIDACREIAPECSAFAIGSYLDESVAVEEFDFVLVLPDSSNTLVLPLVRRLADNFAVCVDDAAIRFAAHFVPRSYAHEITLHGAFYKQCELLERRPRLMSALNDETRIWGHESWSPKEAYGRIPFLDLIFGKWSLVHALTILHTGGWAVPMWTFRSEPPIVQEIEFRLSEPFVLHEFVWYFASKLTANALADIAECGVLCSPSAVKEALQQIQYVILATRNRTIPAASDSDVMNLWSIWVGHFQRLLETAMTENHTRLSSAFCTDSST